MMRRFLHAIPALALAAAPALAGLTVCPFGPEAAAIGIVVTYEDGSSSRTVLASAAGDTVEVFTYPDGYVLHSELMLGLNATRTVELDATGAEVPGTEYLYSYAAAPPAALEPGLQWQTDYSAAGGAADAFGGSYAMTVAAETEVTIGTCRYRSWPVTIFTRDAEYSFLAQADYLPDLQIAILRGYGELLGDKISVTPVTIAQDP